MTEAPFYALKVRLTAKGERDLRTVRLIGAYPTWDAACDGAVRACLAARQDDGAREFRYLVRCRASVPPALFSKSTAGKRRWEVARERAA